LVKVGSNVGIAKFDGAISSFNEVLENAEVACNVSRRHGRNCHKYFDEGLNSEELDRRRIADALSNAIDKDELKLVYMPIVDTKTKAIKKVEVLLRSEGPSLAGIGPDTFIPIAEEFGIIQRVDFWVIERSFAMIQQYSSVLKRFGIVTCINISAKQINNINFTDGLTGLLDKYLIDPTLIELEITETSTHEVDALSIDVLNNLRCLGIGLALDDFGTGYSAFHHIEQYPFNCLKIDKSFLDGFSLNPEKSKATIHAITAIAKSHRLQTVTEGIETAKQTEFIESIECDLMQGYYFYKPIDWSEFIAKVLWHETEIKGQA
jgi:EAL domain-containing protein (putative c-di-GMP-specific phosphodiesterase class I)